ncbi:30S ribosomal protein S9 [Helcococcus massiliensis]|uniref:30S ribosomal protein S9 n=1 Tax=Helcococcus massiliensis TaxID=2040290 RepID=UPI000CDE617A|nr:30S ribosomal protein S9 [Helcococcus massiliensis]
MSNQYNGTGRRKTSVARVRLLPGSGEFLVNGKPLNEYFNYETLIELAKSPLELVEKAGDFDVRVNVKGGGFTGQAGAVRHGVARALVDFDEELKPVLKRAGFLTRDSRKKERKKPGLKKARKSSQFSKR